MTDFSSFGARNFQRDTRWPQVELQNEENVATFKETIGSQRAHCIAIVCYSPLMINVRAPFTTQLGLKSTPLSFLATEALGLQTVRQSVLLSNNIVGRESLKSVLPAAIA